MPGVREDVALIFWGLARKSLAMNEGEMDWVCGGPFYFSETRLA